MIKKDGDFRIVMTVRGLRNGEKYERTVRFKYSDKDTADNAFDNAFEELASMEDDDMEVDGWLASLDGKDTKVGEWLE